MCDRSSARQVPVPGSEVLSDPNSLRGKVYIAAAPAWRQLSELATLLLFNLGAPIKRVCRQEVNAQGVVDRTAFGGVFRI